MSANGIFWIRARTRSGLRPLGSPWAAELLASTIAYFRAALGFRLHAYSILPESLEAVLGLSGRANLSKIMMEVKGSFAHWYNRRLDRAGSLWERRFESEPLLSAEDIRTRVRRVHGLPLRAGLEDIPGSYPYFGGSRERVPRCPLDPLPVLAGELPVEVQGRLSAGGPYCGRLAG